ncbi:restriction endonuclease subunit S [Gelidibacter pelagius]|uniref:Restriction endonuclease subunit S n=1 Tax=Gelidibacter pelagius TaxID=2819985 RepID=A0ABS3SPH3_9FLAO|nr:restriction endonuclease subunit S [Gelidibacter pelagius]MBO3097607.1 restriction endonuclease subunit S [Gelidibacter pelagius]
MKNKTSAERSRSISEGWVETTLGKVIKIIGGGTPKTSVPEYWNGEIPWLSVVDFNDDNRWVSSTEKTITSLGLEKSSTKLLNKGDIIISARGTVGAMAQLKREMTFNQSCYGIRNIENLSEIDFIFYLLKFSLKQINQNTYGAVFDTITTKTFDYININLPPRPEQKAIANVLTAFDDKIENLRAQNDTLEQTAQTIFNEWFGKYQLEDELPEGWRVGKLSDLLDIKYGKDHKHLQDGDYPLYGSGGIMRYVEKPLYKKESILIPRKGTLTNLFYLNQPFWSVDTMFYSKIKNPIQGRFIYLFLKSIDLSAMNVGSAVPSLTTNVLNQIPLIIPENNIMNEFNNIISSFYTKINFNISQIQSLSKTRDTLLSKLMSGELRVKL